MNYSRLTWMLGIALIGAIGCGTESNGDTGSQASGGNGGADGGAGTAGVGGDAGELEPSAAAVAVCDVYQARLDLTLTCCSEAELAAYPQLLAAYTKEVKQCPEWLGALEAKGHIRINLSAVAEARALMTSVCDDRDAIDPPMRAAVVGLQGVGAACKVDAECVDGLTCNVGGFSVGTPDTCIAPPTDVCRPSESQVGADGYLAPGFGYHPGCAPGYSCSYSQEVIGKCSASSDCSRPTDCPVGQFCQANGRCGAGQQGEGEACTGSGNCEAGLYCTLEHVCAPELVAGSPCEPGQKCFGGCVNHGTEQDFVGVCEEYCGSR